MTRLVITHNGVVIEMNSWEAWFQKSLINFPYLNHLYLTIALIVIFQITNYTILKRIQSGKTSSAAEKRVNIKRVKDYSKIILSISIFFLWFSQLQSVFVSLLAFAAAIVIALKEIIMCITGGMLIGFNKYFVNGDRIEVDGLKGFVVGKTITATKLLEIGPERNSQQTTGNIISIPNSVFLAKSIVNQSNLQNYSIRSFIFSPFSPELYDISETKLLEIANAVARDYLKQARDSISSFCKKEGITTPTIEPRVKLLLSENNEAKLLLKMPVDNKDVANIEQRIHREYYAQVIIHRPVLEGTVGIS